MKAFDLGFENLEEILPTIKRRGFYAKEKIETDKRFKKKHQIKDYRNFLDVVALPAISEREVTSIKKQTFAVARKSLVPLPKQTIGKSNSEDIKPVKLQKTETLPLKVLKHKESPRFRPRQHTFNRVSAPFAHILEDQVPYSPFPIEENSNVNVPPRDYEFRDCCLLYTSDAADE